MGWHLAGILTSTVDMRDEARGRPIQKAKVLFKVPCRHSLTFFIFSCAFLWFVYNNVIIEISTLVKSCLVFLQNFTSGSLFGSVCRSSPLEVHKFVLSAQSLPLYVVADGWSFCCLLACIVLQEIANYEAMWQTTNSIYLWTSFGRWR